MLQRCRVGVEALLKVGADVGAEALLQRCQSGARAVLKWCEAVLKLR